MGSLSRAEELLGELVVSEGLITADQLEECQAETRSSGVRLVAHLISKELVPANELTELLARLCREAPDGISLGELIGTDLLRLVPAQIARKRLLIPVARAGQELTIVTAGPPDVWLLDDLRFVTGLEIKALPGPGPALQLLLDACYGEPEPAAQEVAETAEDDLLFLEEPEEGDIGELDDMAEAAPAALEEEPSGAEDLELVTVEPPQSAPPPVAPPKSRPSGGSLAALRSLAEWARSAWRGRPTETQGAEPRPSAAVRSTRFTVFHPREIKPLTWYSLLAYAHVPGALGDVRADSRALLGALSDDYREGAGKETAVIARGAEITVLPQLPGCRFNPPRARISYLEDWHRVDFRLQADPSLPDFKLDEAVNGRVSFFVGPVLVADVGIWAHVSQGASIEEVEQPTGEAVGDPYQAVFVSYAHEDGRIVDLLERAYSVLGLRYLRDVRVLRSGQSWNPELLRKIEEADIFQLCWSQAAKASRYVEQEWRHALAQRRADPFIRPTYWEEPMPKPPSELSHIHFARLEM